MDALLEFGLEATRLLQAQLSFLDIFFKFISALGEEEVYLLFIPLLYWCWNKAWGRHFAYLFVITNFFNFTLKQAFREPRPFWLEPSLNLSSESISYGFPSGHAQTLSTIVLFFAYQVRKRWMWWSAILFIIAVGASRIYLGHHFVHDVVVGAFLGGLVIVGYWLWLRQFHKQFSKRILGFRLMVAVAVPLGLAVIFTAVYLFIGDPNMRVPWADFIVQSELDSIEGVTTVLATMLGTGIGLVFEPSRIRFRVDGAWWKRVVRYLLGMGIAVGIWAGLDAVFPEEPLAIAIPFRVVRYTLLALWITYYAPAFFVLTRLADADPEPEISLKLD